ncbi:MAG: type II toxin-antitoxin system VapC family toxin [Thermoproteus sp.]
MRLVVDASALGALYFPEPQSDYVAEALGGCGECHSVDLIYYEFANVVGKRVVLGELEAGVGRRVVEEAYRLLSTFVMHRAEDLILDAYGLALDLGITVYDGAYVAAARRAGAKLLTTDNKLISALRNRGLSSLVAR